MMRVTKWKKNAKLRTQAGCRYLVAVTFPRKAVLLGHKKCECMYSLLVSLIRTKNESFQFKNGVNFQQKD